MTTMTISYDEQNAQIIGLIRQLLAAGVVTFPAWEEWTEEEEKQAFLCTARKMVDKVIQSIF